MKNGFAVLGIILGIVIGAFVVGTAAYLYNRSNQSANSTTPTTEPTTESTTPSPSSTPTTPPSIPKKESTSLLDGKIHITLSDGWSKLSEYQATITLNGGKYIAGFQLNPEEYLKKGGSYASNLSIVKTTKTAKGSTIYIIRTGGVPESLAMVSSCLPTSDSACSIKYDSQFLFIILTTYTPGSQEVEPVDFSRAESYQALTGFISMVESLDI
jgi:hypothetical protein